VNNKRLRNTDSDEQTAHACTSDYNSFHDTSISDSQLKTISQTR